MGGDGEGPPKGLGVYETAKYYYEDEKKRLAEKGIAGALGGSNGQVSCPIPVLSQSAKRSAASLTSKHRVPGFLVVIVKLHQLCW